MLKIKDNVDLKDNNVAKKLYQCGLKYEWLLNGVDQTITVVRDKNKPIYYKPSKLKKFIYKLLKKECFDNFVKTYNPFERFECEEFIIFIDDEDKKIQFKVGYDEINSKILKNLKEADLVEKVEE